MAKKERDLISARKAKKDEFYTRLEDIELELKHYKKEFKDKVIFCNCDDPYESNFFKYFAMNFNSLGLKKLIATCYGTSPIVYTQLNIWGEEEVIGVAEEGRKSYKVEITEVKDMNGDGAVDLSDVEILIKNQKNVLTVLEGNGDFRSEESLKILEEVDIVVTNPPFSLFRDFLSLMYENNKKFLIIGNTNALTYKETFNLFKEDQIRTGYTHFNTGMFFYVPDYYEKYHRIEDGRKVVRVASSCWFTNLPVEKHNEELVLYKKYTPEEYPTFDNYNAINVNKYTDIPCDYDGLIGVPITFLDKFNPAQFEIVATTTRNDDSGLRHKIYTSSDAKNFGDLNGAPVLKTKKGLETVYARILVRRKK